jgi:hypothetical protein
MLEGLAAVLEACFTAAKALLDRRETVSKERQQLALLTVQFCFIGIADTGEKLLELAGPRPLATLQRMSVDELKIFHALAQRHMSIQLARLEKLNGLLTDREVIDLFDTRLRREIMLAIGDKSKGLYSIGAGLFFYLIFNTNPTGESTEPRDLERSANLISCMYPEIEDGLISIQNAIESLTSLRANAIRYGEIVRQIIPNSDLPKLTTRAIELAHVEAEGIKPKR